MKPNPPSYALPHDDNHDYETGYSKPRKSHQFKPGQSGNPRGRPKNHRNASTLLREALAETVTIRENGTSYTITKMEAAFKQLVNGAAKGDHKSMHKLLPLMLQLEEQERQQEEKGHRPLLLATHTQLVADAIQQRLNTLVPEDRNDQ